MVSQSCIQVIRLRATSPGHLVRTEFTNKIYIANYYTMQGALPKDEYIL